MIVVWIVLYLILAYVAYRTMRKVVRWVNSKRGIVIQDAGENTVYGNYKGYLAPFHEVFGEDKKGRRRVVRWEPDSEAVDAIEKRLASGRAGAWWERGGAMAVSLRWRFVRVDREPLGHLNWDEKGMCFSRGRGKFLDLYLREPEIFDMCPVLDDGQCSVAYWVYNPTMIDIMLEKEQREAGKVDATAPSSGGAQPQQKVDRVVIDGSNVVFADNSNLVVGLKTCLIALGAHKTSYFVFFDANIFHKLEESENGVAQVAMLKELIDKSNGDVALVPAGARADDFILKKADTDGCHVLSNDRYKPYVERYPWIEQGRVHRFSFVDGRLMIPDLDVDVLNC